MKLDYKRNLKKLTPTGIGLILVKLLMIVMTGPKNTFGVIIIHVISAKIKGTEAKTPILIK